MSHNRLHHPSLWASAVLLLGLILLQAGGHQGPAVQADMLSSGGGYTMLTMQGRHAARDNDADTLVLLDVAAGWMLTYEIMGSRTDRRIELIDGGPIARLFDPVKLPTPDRPRP